MILRNAVRAFCALITLGSFLSLSACQTTSQAPQVREMSPVETREMQTREYENGQLVDGMKAVINALQDQGYLISSANEALGVVTAYAESQTMKQGAKEYVEGWTYNATYETIQRREVSASVSLQDKSLRVRINMSLKAINEKGGVIWSVPVQDPKIYQALFSKIDNSLFLAREKI